MSSPELEEMDEVTREIMSKPETMARIKQSLKEIEEGKTEPFPETFEELLAELEEE